MTYPRASASTPHAREGLTFELPEAVLSRLEDRVVERVLRELEDRRPERVGYVDVRGAAGFLGLSVGAVRKLEQRGEIVGYRPNGRLLFARRELDEWVRGGSGQH